MILRYKNTQKWWVFADKTNMIQSRTNTRQSKSPAEAQNKCPKWLKYFGLAGFCFFLVKGLLWLIIPALLFYFGFSE